MSNPINSAVKGGHGLGILYAGLIGMALSDIIPTPADALYFYNQQRLREKFEKGTITAKRYWTMESLNYYGLNLGYWMMVILGVSLVGGDYKKQAKTAMLILAGGAVIGVIGRNIKKDTVLQTKITVQK